MRPVTKTRTLAAAVATAVAAAQTTGGAGALLINGTLASNGVATLPVEQQLGFASTGDLSARTFTITGTNSYGQAISETVVGPNNNTVNTVLNYLTVNSITVNGAVGTNVTVGTIALGASGVIPMDIYANPISISISVELILGAANYTVQYTFDDVYAPGFPNDTTVVWYPHPDLFQQAVTAAGTIIQPVRGIRLLTNSGTGTLRMIVSQAGGIGAS